MSGVFAYKGTHRRNRCLAQEHEHEVVWRNAGTSQEHKLLPHDPQSNGGIARGELRIGSLEGNNTMVAT